jgi:hypothetical protein
MMRAAALSDHDLRGELAAEEAAVEVDRDDPAPEIQPRLLDRGLAVGHARVVDHHIEATSLAHRTLDQSLELVVVRDVDDLAVSGRAERFARAVHALGVDVAEVDGVAGADECSGDREPDARTRAGHQDGAALLVQICLQGCHHQCTA